MGVEDHSFDILRILVVLESALVQSLLLTELGNSSAVELVPLVHLEDGIGYLRGSHEVHLEYAGLPKTVFWAVGLHAIDEEGSHLLNSVELEEDLGDGMHIDVGVLREDRFSHVQSTLRVLHHECTDHPDVIGSHTSLRLQLKCEV